MKKEELENLLSDFDNEIRNLKSRKNKVISDYIEENSEFKLMDKVKVTTPESKDFFGRIIPEEIEIGFIVELTLSYSNRIEYKIKKQNKKGLVSNINIYINSKSIIEKL